MKHIKKYFNSIWSYSFYAATFKILLFVITFDILILVYSINFLRLRDCDCFHADFYYHYIYTDVL